MAPIHDDCNLGMIKEMPKETQTHPCLEPKLDPCQPAHNEFICHTMGEKRQHYLKEVKKILDKLDAEDCPVMDTIQGKFGVSDNRPIIKFPGYVDMSSPKYQQPFYTPLITNVQVKEIRPTSEMWKHRQEKCLTVDYIPVDEVEKCPAWTLPRSKSYELRAGIMYRGCDCHKHNGLQDRCERSDCGGAPACLTQPIPSCEPSQGFIEPPPQRPVNDMVREVVQNKQSVANKTYCCCPTTTKNYTTIGGKRYPDCNDVDGPGKFECYKCKQ